MTWQLHPARERFTAYAADWDRLNAALYGRHPFFDSRFIGPLLQHFGTGDELLCTHHSHGAIDGALILRPLGLGRWSLFLPAQSQAGAVLLKNARPLETLLPALPGHAWSLDLLSIDPSYAPDWSGLRLPRRLTPHALTMAVRLDGDFAGYWQARPKNLQKNIRRYQRRAEETLGPLRLTCITNPAELSTALARYGQLESAGWKGKTGTAIAADNPQGRFYADMLNRFASNGQAQVMEMHAGERLVASRLLIRHEHMWMILKTTYDETQAPIAPGRLQLHAVLEHAFADTADGTLEFYTNASRDQAEWATVLRPIPHHQVFRNKLSAGLFGILNTLHKPRPDTQDETNAFTPLAVHSYPDIATLPPAAIELFDEAETDYPEFAAGWFANLQRTVYGDDPGVRYYVAERAGQPVAILPVRLARYGIVRRVEALGNFYTSLYSPLLAPKATELDLAALLQAASHDHGGAHEMRFAPMDPDAPAYVATLAALRSIGWMPFRYFCFGNWHLAVDSDWKTYLERRSGELRSTLKRKGKKFADVGGTLEIITDPAHAEAAIADFNHVYSRSWKKPEPYPDFIPGLIRWLAERGWLRLGIARLDGHPIAAEIWIVAHRRARIYKLAHDENQGGYAPGTLLTARLMEHANDMDGVVDVDFLAGDDAYKQSWMNHRRERNGIVAYNAMSLIGFIRLTSEVLWRASNRLRDTMTKDKSDNIHLKPRQTKPNTAGKPVWSFYPAAYFSDIAAKWQSLCDKTTGSPVLSADFVATALKHFGKGDELVCLAENSEGIVAGAVLTRINPLIWQTFQPSQMPLGPWLQNRDASLADTAASLLRQLPGPAIVLGVTQIDPDFYPVEVRPNYLIINSILTGRIVMAADLKSHMSSGSVAENPKLAAELMRRMRKAEKNHGVVSLKVETTPESAKDFVNHYAAIESRGWKGDEGTALVPDDQQARFYSDLMSRFARRSNARMYTLRFGELAVAQQIAVTGSEVMVLLKTTYEPEFRSLGPGVIQMYKIIEDAFVTNRAPRVIELYGPFNDSQKLWVKNEHKRMVYHANIYRFSQLQNLHNGIRKLKNL